MHLPFVILQNLNKSQAQPTRSLNMKIVWRTSKKTITDALFRIDILGTFLSWHSPILLKLSSTLFFSKNSDIQFFYDQI